MKKLLAILAGVLAAAPALADTSTIQLPPTFTADVLTQATNLMSSTGIGPYLALIVGTLLALVAAEFLIGAIRHR